MRQNCLNMIPATLKTQATRIARIVVFFMLLLPFLAACSQDIFTRKPAVRDPSIVPPGLIYMQEPDLSKNAAARHRGGIVEVSMLVDETGLPTELKVRRSSSLELNERALQAVRRYRFAPALKNGKPVAVRVQTAVDFGRADGLTR